MLDDELEEAIAAELPENIPYIFISAITHKGLTELKDILWKELNNQQFQDIESIVYKPMDIKMIDMDDDFDFSMPDTDEDDDDPLNYDEIDWENEE